MSDQAQEDIRELVSKNKVVLFMKGSPDCPQCGFSARATAVVRALGVDFVDIDVLSNPAIREGIKVYSNWPTIPQLYINGELVGGSDIMVQMFESGELQEMI